MRIRIIAALGICLCFLGASCSSGGASAIPCQNTVDAFSSLLQNYTSVPEHLQQKDAVKTGEEFDVNEYFSVLKHLSMQPGYVLDYVYLYQGIGGEPILYARQKDQPPYRTYSDYMNSIGESSKSPWDYMASIRVDDTPEGFFQLIVLGIMGTQFYQYWHAGYNDHRIICDRAGLEAILVEPDEFGQKIPLLVRARALLLKVEPTIEFSDDSVTVQVVVFTKWGGFLRQSYTLNRDFPHTIIQEKTETLVAYDCGVRF